MVVNVVGASLYHQSEMIPLVILFSLTARKLTPHDYPCGHKKPFTMPLVFELSSTPAAVSGTVNYYELNTGGSYAPVITSPNPTHIHADQDWEVRLEGLTQSGALFGSWGGNTWRLRLYVEMIGGGEHLATYDTTFAVNTTTPTFTYPDKVISIPAGSLVPGLYKLYAELVMLDAGTPNQTPIAGAGELTPSSGTILQVMAA